MIRKYILTLIVFLFMFSPLYSSGYYIITLKHGTQIKANSVIKQDGYIKVYKYGGYIIYPTKSIKSIKFIKIKKILPSQKGNDNNTKLNKCGLKINNFSANPILNKEEGIFNVEINGKIINNCEDTFKNVKVQIQFMNNNKNLIAEKTLKFEEVLPLSEKKFHKVYTDIIADNISYFLYKLQYLREK